MHAGKRVRMGRNPMRARLYLGDISQEKIRPEKIGKASLAEYFKPGDAGIVICCDAFCCILDCDRPVDPRELVTRKERQAQWAPTLVLRKEKFGGLVWNRQTGHVWEIDEKATRVCFDLAKGRALKKVCEKHEVNESDLFSLLAEVTRQL